MLELIAFLDIFIASTLMMSKYYNCYMKVKSVHSGSLVLVFITNCPLKTLLYTLK